MVPYLTHRQIVMSLIWKSPRICCELINCSSRKGSNTLTLSSCEDFLWRSSSARIGLDIVGLRSLTESGVRTFPNSRGSPAMDLNGCLPLDRVQKALRRVRNQPRRRRSRNWFCFVLLQELVQYWQK